jgi:hypothetical protein
MRSLKKVGLLIVFICLLVPGSASADNLTCTGAVMLTADGTQYSSYSTGATLQDRWFRFVAQPNRSYAILEDNPNPSDVSNVYWSDAFTACTAGVPSGTLPASGITWTNLSDAEPVTWDLAGGAGRWSMMTRATGGTIWFSVKIEIAWSDFAVRIEDTTQINTFFSTYSGFNTFYRLANTTNQTLTVRLRMVNDAGTVVRDTTFAIAANRSAPTRNTTAGDLNIPANTGGFTMFTNNGAPNALALDGFLMQGTIVLPIKIVDARQRR